MFDEALKDGTSVATLTRGSLTKERLPYPARGIHSLRLLATERKAVRAALGDMTPGGFVRRAILSAAGLPDGLYKRARVVKTVPQKVGFYLTPEERKGVDACLLERDLTAWMREAVRHAAGLKNAPYTDCANATLRKHFRRLGLEALQRALPGRNPQALYFQALKLGCETELTEDRMTLHQAALWSGYTPSGLLRRLETANVEVFTLAGSEKTSDQRRRFVRRADVSRMMKASYESVAEAARRHGCDQSRLSREVIAAGHGLPTGKRYWLLPAAVFDEVVKAWRARLHGA